MIRESDVDQLLIDALPEFRQTVRDHRATWPDSPMLYGLIGLLFHDLTLKAYNSGDLSLVCRVFDVVEKALDEGDPSVHDCFAIEMLEPLASDPPDPDLRFAMGPRTRVELAKIIEWGRKYDLMNAVLEGMRDGHKAPVLKGFGFTRKALRVIVSLEPWKGMDAADRERVSRRLASAWSDICSADEIDSSPASFEITDEALSVLAR